MERFNSILVWVLVLTFIWYSFSLLFSLLSSLSPSLFASFLPLSLPLSISLSTLSHFLELFFLYSKRCLLQINNDGVYTPYNGELSGFSTGTYTFTIKDSFNCIGSTSSILVNTPSGTFLITFFLIILC